MSPSRRWAGDAGTAPPAGTPRPDQDLPQRSADTKQPEVLAAAHAAADRLVAAARVICRRPLPVVGSPEWLAAPWVAQAATLVVLGEAQLLRGPDEVAEDEHVVTECPDHYGDPRKAAAVAISEELKRERDLVRRRKDEIGAALRRGDADRAYALTVHHAGWNWAEEMA